jgi:hypothetical protein
MSNEIIWNVACDNNYDDFQHFNFIFSQNFFSLFEDYLMMKMTLGQGILAMFSSF